jgi:hypothetical protein
MRAGAAPTSPATAGLIGLPGLTDRSAEWRPADVVSRTGSPSAAICRSTWPTAAAKPGSLLTCALLWK